MMPRFLTTPPQLDLEEGNEPPRPRSRWRRWAAHALLLLCGPVLAALDALDAGRLGVLHLLRARLLMQDDKRAASRRTLKRHAYELLASPRAAAMALPLTAAVGVALALVLFLASPAAPTAAVAAPLCGFFALLFGTVVVGGMRVLRLPGANTVVYQSDSIRANATNAQALLLRAINILQVIALTLEPFNLELQADAGAASAFAKMLLRNQILPLLDATLLRIGGLSAATKYWGGAALALALVVAWLGVFRHVLVEHEVREERSALYKRELLSRRWPWPLRGLKAVWLFQLLGSDLLLFVAAKLMSTVHCSRGAADAAWQFGDGAGACFNGLGHRSTVLVALMATLMYIPTAVLYGSTILVRSEGRFSDPESDVTFSPAFTVAEKCLKVRAALYCLPSVAVCAAAALTCQHPPPVALTAPDS